MTGDDMKHMYFMFEDAKLADIDFNDIGNVVKAQIDKTHTHLLPFSVKNEADAQTPFVPSASLKVRLSYRRNY